MNELSKVYEQMTDEQRVIYDTFYSKVDRLKSEWVLCDTQYKNVINILQTSESNFMVYSLLKRISNYWSERKSALERAITKEMLNDFKR